MAMLDDIPAWNWRLQMNHLVNLWMHHSDEGDDHPVRDGPAQAMPRSYDHAIISKFSLLGQDESRRDHWKILKLTTAHSFFSGTFLRGALLFWSSACS